MSKVWPAMLSPKPGNLQWRLATGKDAGHSTGVAWALIESPNVIQLLKEMDWPEFPIFPMDWPKLTLKSLSECRLPWVVPWYYRTLKVFLQTVHMKSMQNAKLHSYIHDFRPFVDKRHHKSLLLARTAVCVYCVYHYISMYLHVCVDHDTLVFMHSLHSWQYPANELGQSEQPAPSPFFGWNNSPDMDIAIVFQRCQHCELFRGWRSAINAFFFNGYLILTHFVAYVWV